MLIDHIIECCDREYKSSEYDKVCLNCNHICKCSGGCKKCLEEVHFPYKYPNGKKDYDCTNLLNFYMCDYTYKYTSEILYLLQKSTIAKQFEYFNIMSIGCGGCPDLMAFEIFVNEYCPDTQIGYWGIDRNLLWKSIHNNVISYCDNVNIKTGFKYDDVLSLVGKEPIKATNVIVLQYFLSHLYNTQQITERSNFYDNLIKNVIDYRSENTPFLIMINDVNSTYRGRDYFEELCDKLTQSDYQIKCQKYYFDYRIQNDKQRYGSRHNENGILFDIPREIDFYEPWKVCSSAQMLIEIC